MKISGTIVQILPLETGTGPTGQWRKQDYILRTDGKIPKSVCFSIWGEKVEQFKLQVGSEVVVYVEIESVSFKGKWYTNVKGWKVEPVSPATPEVKESENLFANKKADTTKRKYRLPLTGGIKEVFSLGTEGEIQLIYEASEFDVAGEQKDITFICLLDDKGNEFPVPQLSEEGRSKVYKALGNLLNLLTMKKRKFENN